MHFWMIHNYRVYRLCLTPVILCSIPVPPRKVSKKISARGLFPEAKVVRGQDWIWGNQDGERATLNSQSSLKLHVLYTVSVWLPLCGSFCADGAELIKSSYSWLNHSSPSTIYWVGVVWLVLQATSLFISDYITFVSWMYTGGFDKPGMIKNLKGNSQRNEVQMIWYWSSVFVVLSFWYWHWEINFFGIFKVSVATSI